MSTVVLGATAVWHFLAFWHFCLFPQRTLKRTTDHGGDNVIAAELFRFLGAMNLAFVVLATWAMIWPMGPGVFVCLAVANVSQLIVDVRVKRLGLARGPMFMQVMYGDALFTVANVVAYIGMLPSAWTSA